MGDLRGIDGRMPLSNTPTACLIEFKDRPARRNVARLWMSRWPRQQWRFQVVVAVAILIAGAWIPGFLPMLAVLLGGLAATLGGFVLFIQIPMSYIIRRWHARREASLAG